MRIRATLVAIALLGLPGCQDEVPTGPTNADFDAARSELAARSKDKSAKDKNKAKAKAKAKKPAATQDPSYAALGKGFHYDRRGKRDPFRSFEMDEKGRLALELMDQSPLERYDVSQLSLLAIVWNTGAARALIQDPGGKSYIVGTGTRLGKNEGRVIDIDDNLLVVKETYVDFLGQETTKDIEMRIRRSEGG